MNTPVSCSRIGSVILAAFLLLSVPHARGDTTTISTASFAFDGTGTPRYYQVPAGANFVTIQAWGAQNYVQASYVVQPGNSIAVRLSGGNGGDTMVTTPNGTVHIAGGPGVCVATGTSYLVSMVSNWSANGPVSPGVGSKYQGYVIITAKYGLYTLSISTSPASAGTTTGAGSYPFGYNAPVVESPWNGYSGSGWKGPSYLSVASPSSPSSTIAMTGDASLIATFTPNVPVFTSSAATETLVVGRPFIFQVTATQSPVFLATRLPPGLTMSSSGLISGTPTAAGVGLWSAAIEADNDAISVKEDGVGANEIVNLSSSTLGNNLNAYAGIINIGVNGQSSTGFCIDPWHSSQENTWLYYNWESLATGPKIADGMGATTALQIGQLWDQYYTQNINSQIAAGLQIAIWDLVTASIGAQTGGADWYTLNSSNDYGASQMIAWVEANPNAAAANLYAITGNGQDYVTASSSLPQPVAAAASATQLKGFMVYPQPTVASATYTIPVNQPYSYAISATGNPTSYGASSLPTGFSVSTGGTISGTPTAVGTYTIGLTVSNPGASASGTLTLNVVQTYSLAITTAPGASAGSASGAGTYMAGTVVSIQESPAYGWAATGWGGPNAAAVASAGSASTTVTMNGNYSLVANFNPITPVLSGGLPPVMLVGRSVTAQVSATPASTLSASNLPPGLSWNASGSIGSAPSHIGNYTATFSANNNGATATENTSTTVYPQLSLPTASATTKENLPFSYSVGAPAWGSTLGATGLPGGLTMNPNTGMITGTPTESGTFTIALNEQNPATSATGSLVLTVTATYTLTITGASGGTTTGAGVYDPGTLANVTEAAASHYRTNGWGGANAGSLGNAASASTSIVMNGNYTISPLFVQQAILTIASATGGTATGGGTYDVGSVQTISAIANANYQFATWAGAGIASLSSAATTISITGDETITPSFLALPSATITAPSTAYTGSPLTVKSSAYAPSDNLTLHSIEWMAPDGTWSLSVTSASGTEDDRTYGITFPTIGTYVVRGGASTDSGSTWYYSPTQQIAVSDGFTNYTFQTMAVPAANMVDWYNPSSVAQKTYTVQHKNP